VATFSGLPVEAFEFYDQLTANNTKSWWNEHKSDYERYVRTPLVDLVTALSDEFGEAKLFRPYRDVRFAKDKSPIKEHQGAYVSTQDAVGYYVQVSSSGLMVAGGWYASSGDQLKRYREAVDGGKGPELRTLLAALAKQRWQLESNSLKTRPRGYGDDPPDLDLLRFRHITAERHYDVEAWMGTSRVADRIRQGWRQLTPLVDWLTETVGPSGER
jgi:uncharacterized protein (TIGR02453 family)